MDFGLWLSCPPCLRLCQTSKNQPLKLPWLCRPQGAKSQRSSCPKCSANSITVTPIWKQEFVNGEHPIRILYRIFLKNLFSNFRFHTKDSKWSRKCIFINCTSCNRSPKQIPYQFANGKLPNSHCRAFWA